MATKKKTALKKDAAKAAPKKKSAASAKETSAKAAKAKTRVQKTAAKSAAAAEKTATRATATKKTAEKSKKALAKTRKRAVKVEEEAGYQIGEAVPDPIGDVSSGEARTYLGEVEAPGQAEMEAYRAETETAALAGTLEAEEEMKVAAEAASEAGAEDEDAGAAQPPAKLERLQKILSQAGIASRRRAEEMIVAGRVMVNVR